MKMTNAEAVDILTIAKENLPDKYFLDSYINGAFQSRKTYKGDIEPALTLAIATLSPKPLELGVEGWKAYERQAKYFQNVGEGFEVKQQRGHYTFKILLNPKSNLIRIRLCCFDNVIKQKKYKFLEKSFINAIAQLNAWLDELINELRGAE